MEVGSNKSRVELAAIGIVATIIGLIGSCICLGYLTGWAWGFLALFLSCFVFGVLVLRKY